MVCRVLVTVVSDVTLLVTVPFDADPVVAEDCDAFDVAETEHDELLEEVLLVHCTPSIANLWLNLCNARLGLETRIK